MVKRKNKLKMQFDVKVIDAGNSVIFSLSNAKLLIKNHRLKPLSDLKKQ